MRAMKYTVGLLPALLSFVSIALAGGWSFMAPIVIFGLIPLLELALKPSETNLEDELEADIRNARVFDVVLYLTVPVQFALLGYFLWRMSTGTFAWWEVAGMTLSMGMSCGTLGINAAHELGHRRKVSEQRMAKALLLTTLYTHFFIEHNRGHHSHVATDEDPASSRLGESLFAFFPRTIVGSWMSAWRLERDRLSKLGRRWLTWDNEMLRLQLLQVVFTGAIFAAFGPVAGLAFLGAAATGALLLETVNYLEHYGLRREPQGNGRYERVLPIHSWNSNHPIGRLFLFELSRHSDHHANARRKYQVLRHFDHSPQLPTGYPGMMVLAWMPPLWFAVMHRHMERERARVTEMGERAAVVPLDGGRQAA